MPCRLENVTMTYGKATVLNSVTMQLPEQGIMALAGPNGAGKSTLIKILAGILKPVKGKIINPGGHLTVGYMPESCNWIPQMTGLQFLNHIKKFKKNVRDEHIGELLQQLNLKDQQHKKIRNYSKGMKQRLGLIQALLGQPDLLILDEPTNGLDPEGIQDFYKVLTSYAEMGHTILLSSHLLAEIEGHVSHIAFIKDGVLLASGSRDELLKNADLPVSVTFHLRSGHQDTQMQECSRLIQKLETQGARCLLVNDALQVTSPPAELKGVISFVPAFDALILDVEIARPGLNELYALSCARVFADKVATGNAQTDQKTNQSQAFSLTA